MRFIPGSHLLGHLTYTLSENDETNVLNQTVTGAEEFGQPIDDQLMAGEISIHSDLLLHGSEPNQSKRRRCGLTLRYCPTSVRAELGWNAKGVVVSGKDESGHWAYVTHGFFCGGCSRKLTRSSLFGCTRRMLIRITFAPGPWLRTIPHRVT